MYGPDFEKERRLTDSMLSPSLSLSASCERARAPAIFSPSLSLSTARVVFVARLVKTLIVLPDARERVSERRRHFSTMKSDDSIISLSLSRSLSLPRVLRRRRRRPLVPIDVSSRETEARPLCDLDSAGAKIKCDYRERGDGIALCNEITHRRESERDFYRLEEGDDARAAATVMNCLCKHTYSA